MKKTERVRKGFHCGTYRFLTCLRGSEKDRSIVYYDDIIYMYKVKGTKYVEFVTTDGSFRERITLKDLLSELDRGQFIPVERSYVINLNYVTGIRGNEICLGDRYRVPMSRERIGGVCRRVGFRKNGRVREEKPL